MKFGEELIPHPLHVTTINISQFHSLIPYKITFAPQILLCLSESNKQFLSDISDITLDTKLHYPFAFQI